MGGRLSRLGGRTRVWLLSAGLFPLAVLAVHGIRDLPSPPTPTRVPTLAFIPLFYAAELIVIHFRFRRDAHSFSISEVPLVMGLFLLSPLELVAVQVTGSAIALTVNRRQPPVKLSFNLIQITLQGATAGAVFQSVLGRSDPLGHQGWLAVLAAILSTLVVSNTLIGVAIRLSGGSHERTQQWGMLAIIAGAGLMNAALGLVAVTILWTRPASVWIAAIPPMVLYFAYRAYVSQRQERERLQALYEASEELHRLIEPEEAMAALVERARLVFDVETAEALLFPDGITHPGYRTAATADGNRVVMAPIPPLDDVSYPGVVMISGRPATQSTRVRGGERAMAVPIPGPSGPIGLLSVVAPLGDIGTFSPDDLRLLETLAGHLGVSFENGRLEDSLARMSELKERLHQETLEDGLTGLGNRRLLQQRLSELVESSSPGAVLFLDLDDFKAVNDTHGHQVGDLALIEVGYRLRESCRPSDTIARMGGDEFAVVLQHLHSPEDAEIVAQRIGAHLDRAMRIGGVTVKVTTSIGVVLFDGGSDPDLLIEAADAAMYAAKRAGKGTYRMHGSDRGSNPTELRRALQRSELVVHYQPIVDLFTGEVAALEALVRWNDPHRGLLPPGEFVCLAERTGLIHEVGARVTGLACESLAHWKRELGDRLPVVALNVSAPELAEPSTTRRVLETAERYGIDPAALQVEITETAVMSGDHRVLTELRRHGVTVALDDFGTGYSSLAYLDRLPIDVIKIDRSFIARVGDAKAATLIRMMVDMADALGFIPVAEGIETAEQMAAVLGLGCRMGQGFYIGRPLPPAETYQLIRAGGSLSLAS